MLCTTATGHPPFLPIDACVELRKIVSSIVASKPFLSLSLAHFPFRRQQPFCREEMYSSCVNRLDLTECEAYFGYCAGANSDLIAEYGLNPFDLRRVCSFPCAVT